MSLDQRHANDTPTEVRVLDDIDLTLIRRLLSAAQYRFCEDPAAAVAQTERVLVDVLRAKGYPLPDRLVLDEPDDDDIEALRQRLLRARKSIADLVGNSVLAQESAGRRPLDLRIEFDASPASANRAPIR